MKDTYYRTAFTFAVLSEEPIPDHYEIDHIIEECATGEYIGDWSIDDRRQEALTPKQMASALRAAHSDPSFFQLDDDGNHIED